jgi:hypothetical protein
MSITMKRPLTTLQTRLCDIPLGWLRFVEPKIMRGSFLPCWIWTGALDMSGYPVMRIPGETQNAMLHHFVAGMYWDYPPKYFVGRTCQNINCLNPSHLVPQAKNPRWSPPASL